MQQATDKNFSKILIKFAEAKAARDKFLPVAEQAWELLAPIMPVETRKGNHAIDELEPQATSQASEALPENTKNTKKTSTV
jgi:hypothetical protein